MGFITLAIVLTWGFGYLVAIETLQGNALVTGYVEVTPDLATVPYFNRIQVAAAKNDVDPALIAAIVSQESSSNPDAVSRAGARGLMQILPSTWRLLCPKAHCQGEHLPPACGPDCIFNPEANLRAGTAYFAGILRQFDDNIVLAFAAYNAGTAAVRHYAGEGGPAAGSDPSDDFDSLPPFAETRAYVRKVLAFWVRLRSTSPPDVVTLTVEECLLLRQLATVLPVVVLGLWALFGAWVLRRFNHVTGYALGQARK